jgi:hypothetical protein
MGKLLLLLLGLVMNVLCGRSPVYRVEEFFRTRDVALLLGDDISIAAFNDDAIGRVLDRFYNYGTWKMFPEICVKAFQNFEVNCAVVHQDSIYVADCALATEENLALMGDGILFITRLPENFAACGQLITKAVGSGSWRDVGRLTHRIVRGVDICASYRLREENLDG